jgi:hypothetical protein
MKCEGCQAVIPAGEEKEHLGRVFCEDCYMEALSPMKTCDPWAVHSAKTLEKSGGGALTAIQSEILAVLKRTGGVEPPELLKQLSAKIAPQALEREFAALRHMEKARAEKRGDRVFWRLW